MDPDASKSDNLSTEDKATAAFNSTILNYYRKFGKKRGLERFFVSDTGLFWKGMEKQNDSSDSSDKKTESPTEICRISIKCSIPDESAQPELKPPNIPMQVTDRQSPPIVTDEMPGNISRQSEAESELNTSQKSIDPNLDVSSNKPLSPTGSITYHRKLEWDSLADVGYDNESHRKNSASGLSTLEKLALKQQYSNNDKYESTLGLPTAESTPLDENKDIRSKLKSSKNGKSTKIHKKDVVRVNVPHSDNVQSVNFNLTKHISVNVDKDSGAVTTNISQSPDKVSVETEITPKLLFDKEIQTTLLKDTSKQDKPTPSSSFNQPAPVVIHLNSLRRHLKTKKIRTARSIRRKRRINNKKKQNLISQDKTGEQVSEAESFEYMPGHIYNQNQHERSDDKNRSVAGNKSSLESSGVLTTESSKTSVKSFTKDLEKGVELLNNIIQQHQDNSKLKKKLVRDIVSKLINTKYRGDDSEEFKSGLLFSSTTLGLGTGDYKTSTTTSTSDGNTSNPRPRKSILRTDKFDSTAVTSTAQSVPNLAIASTSEVNVSYKPESSGTDGSSKGRNSSESLTTSEELYLKYLEVRRKEQLYKKYLIEKEMFLKKKLVGSEGQSLKPSVQNNKINDLMRDLTKNNYDCGDAKNLKDKNLQNEDYVRQTRSHSVFTLSSGNSNKKPNSDDNKQDMRLKLQREIEKDPVAGTSRNINSCSCQCHSIKIDVTDSAVQVNELHPRDVPRQQEATNIGDTKLKKISGELLTNTLTGELKYVCFCANGCGRDHEVPDNFLIYKCSRLSDQATQNDFKKCNRERETVQGKPSVTSISSVISKEVEVQAEVGSINFGRENEINICACVQTDIYCNPKLSDPSLSDLNNINEAFSSKATQTPLRSDNNKTPESPEEVMPRYCNCKENVMKDKFTRDFVCQTDNTQNIANLPDHYTIPLAGTNIELTVDMKDAAKKSGNIQVKPIASQSLNAESAKENNVKKVTSNKLHSGILRIRSSSSDNIIDRKERSCSEEAKSYSTTTTPRTHALKTQVQKQKEGSAKCCSNVKSCENKQQKKADNPDKEISSVIKVSLRTKSPNREDIRRPNYYTYPTQTAKTNKPFTRRNTDSNVTIAYNCNCEDPDCGNESTNSQHTLKEVGKPCKSSASSSRKSCTDESITPEKQTDSSQRRKDGSDKSKSSSRSGTYGDPIMDMIKDITRRYSKRDAVKNNKKKCFKEVMTLLNYLVDTDDSGDIQPLKTEESCNSSCNSSRKKRDSTTNCSPIRLVDKGVQPTPKKSERVGESSDVCCSDAPRTSTNSQASKLLNKIQRQCERYTQRRSKSSQREKVLESTTSTSESYAKCNKEQYCNCSSQACMLQKESHSCKVPHKCKNVRPKLATDKEKNKCVAYNLIIQTSDGLPSDEKTPDKNRPPLRNIVVKVPSKRKTDASIKPNFNTDYKDKYTSVNKPFRTTRSRSLPGESDISSNDDAFKRTREFTVRHYLEKNRPDFVERTARRQDCLKIINEARSDEYRKLLSLRLARQPDVNEVSVTDLRELASALGIHLKNKIPAPKFISEKEMKKHSEKIYKNLPEVVRKKEELKKERIKKTNLIMASLFKKVTLYNPSNNYVF